MVDSNPLEYTYNEKPYEVEVTIQPSDGSEIRMQRSQLKFGETVLQLGDVVEEIREVPGVDTAYPRGDRIYLTVDQRSIDEFRRVVNDIFSLIYDLIADAEDQTRERLRELSRHADPSEDRDHR